MSDWRSIPSENKHREFLKKFSAILIDFAFESVSRDNPVSRWRSASYLQEILDFDLLEEPKPQKDLLLIANKILKYSVKTGHPYFMNQLFSGLDPYGLAGQWLTDALNASVYTYEVAPVLTLMEKTLTRKLLSMFYKNDNGCEFGDGLFCPGGSFANGTAINLARFSFRCEKKDSMVKPTLFASEDAHYSVSKWANLCNVDVVLVKTDDLGRMSVDDLKICIRQEQEKGSSLFMVMATAGTTVLGAFDPLIEIAEICQDLKIWLHVDAAWGGGLIFSKKHCGLLRGIERADSILFNPHKLLAVPQQCSLFLTKHHNILTKAHSKGATYLFQKDKFYSADLDPGDKYLQCGRRADVLKFWFMWQAKGSLGFERHIDHLMSLSAFFKDEIEKKKHFELVTQPCFINVCFWFIPLHLRDKDSICNYEEELSKVAPKLKGMMTKRDPRVAKFPLMQDPFVVMLILVVYLEFVLHIGPRYMKHRKPYKLKNFLIVYNCFLAIASGIACYGILTSGYTTNLSLGCEPFNISYDPEPLNMASWVWRVFIMKVIELSDTIIFVLRKKYNQTSFLHVYHHSSTVIMAWTVCKYVPGGMWTFIMIPNCIVHVFMYTYYLLAALGSEVKEKIMPVKKYITKLQMIQFIIMLLHTVQALMPSCDPNKKFVACMYMMQVTIMLYLFWGFYKKAYTRKKLE